MMNRNTVLALSAIGAMACAPAHAGEWEDKVIRLLPMMAPGVKTVQWGQPGSLWLFVADNGRNRDGLAQGICGELQGLEGSPERSSVIVRVWDALMKGPDELSLLGYATCSLKR